MSSAPDNSLSKTAFKSLPAEILAQIFTMCESQLEVDGRAFRHPNYQPLFDLRLVCKSWSDIALPIAFSSIRITNTIQAQNFLQDWNTIFSYIPDSPPRHFPVRRLELVNLVEDIIAKANEKPDKAVGEANEVDPRENQQRLASNPHVSIHEATELIRLFCENLETLKLRFYSSVNCPNPLVDAVRIAKSITELIVESDTPVGSSNLVNLLEAVPDLEELRIGYTGVPSMTFSKSALTKLRYLEFLYEYSKEIEDTHDEVNPDDYSDLRGIVNICEKARSSLKVIECYAADQNGSGLLPVITAVKDTLEGLFTGSMCHQWPGAPLLLECPRLRVVSTVPWDSMCLYLPSFDAYEGWFCWPILRHARTLVFPIEYTLSSWLHFFEHAPKGKRSNPSTTSREEGLFRNLPNLRQCLFRTRSDVRFPHPSPLRDRKIPHCFPENELPLSLIQDFEAYGIKCFAIDNLKPDEIMALDAKLDTNWV